MSPKTAQAKSRRPYIDVFIVSVFILYLEILLIRWISTEIRLFAYFKNLTLIACFLGIGLGCLLSRRKRPTFVLTFPLVVAFVMTVVLPQFFNRNVYTLITQYLGDFNDIALWSLHGGLKEFEWPMMVAALGLLVCLFAFIATLFIPSGRLLGQLMEQCPNRIGAYSVNIIGSLIGIWCFAIVSFLSLPPVVWFGSALFIGLPLLSRGRAIIVGVTSIAATTLLFIVFTSELKTTVWSPYQKLAHKPLTLTKPDGSTVSGGHQLEVNETFYQRVVNLDPAFLNAHADLFQGAENSAYFGYNTVYRLLPNVDNVLVVGAGTGNDVAAALRNGAGHVDAVEIDPKIVEMGRAIHPERPYDDSRVTLHIDDARSFFRKTTRKYDLIFFGALDSHTLVSNLSNIRIDNYVYTVEAFAQARELLTDDGILCLVFAAERPFIFVRLFDILQSAFGHEPVAFDNHEIAALGGAGGGPTFLADKHNRIRSRLSTEPKVAFLVNQSQLHGKIQITRDLEGAVPPSTDDWPYLYLQGRFVPRLYLIVTTALIFLAALSVRPFMGEFRNVDPHFFMLGAAFLLVEVQAISKMALLFGTTWVVTSIVITAILIMILAANALAIRWRPRALTVIYGLLAGTLVLNYFFPVATLLNFPPLPRALLAGFVMGLPIAFAGLIFAYTFANAERPDIALGSNLLGAIVGGACECLSFIVGINALGWLAVGFYALSLIALRRRGQLQL